MDIEQRISDNMGLVYAQLHKFKLAYNDEAFSFAMEALMSAARTYKEEKNIQFSTYATSCIYNSLCGYLRSVKKAAKLDVVSYDEPISDETETTIKELMVFEASPEEWYIRKEFHEALCRAASDVLNEMTGINKKICVAWWDSSCTLKQRELANDFNTSQTTISRALSEFKNKIKKEMEDYL